MQQKLAARFSILLLSCSWFNKETGIDFYVDVALIVGLVVVYSGCGGRSESERVSLSSCLQGAGR